MEPLDSESHVAPPSVVCRMTPSCPTTYTSEALAPHALHRSLVTPLACGVNGPPLRDTRIVPCSPTAYTTPPVPHTLPIRLPLGRGLAQVHETAARATACGRCLSFLP